MSGPSWLPQKGRRARRLAQRVTFLALVTFALVFTAAINPTSANAYKLSGCKWPTKTMSLQYSTGTRDGGTYEKSLNRARYNINDKTKLTIARSTKTQKFSAIAKDRGRNGWVGMARIWCLEGKTPKAEVNVNKAYTKGKSRAYIQLVWLHELSHANGLEHVGTVRRVMYKTMKSYSAGVRALTSDEIAGYRRLYG